MIWEGREVDQLAAGGGQGLLDLPRLGDPGEADLRPFRHGGGRFQTRDQHGGVAELGQELQIGLLHLDRQQHDHRVGARQAHLQRFAHGAGWEDAAVAEGPLAVAGLAVDHDQRQGLADRGVLVPVVHDDDLRPGPRGSAGPGDAIDRDPHREVLGQHQWLVADVGGGVASGIDLRRPFQLAAIAARQAVSRDAALGQGQQQFADNRRLARPAHGDVADADHRRADDRGRGARDALARGVRPQPRDRGQQGAGQEGGTAASHIPPTGRAEFHGTSSRMRERPARASWSRAST